jgi:stage III sporulation protein AB
MWIKIIGGILVVAATSWIGLETARRFQRRPRQLREMQSGLQMLETEISYVLTPLPKALEKIAQSIEGHTGDFFGVVKNQIINNPGAIREAWGKGMDYLGEHCALTDCDQNILRNFGTTLGKSDRQDQVKHLKLAMAQLATAETNAWEEKAKNERMFKALGLLGGLAIVILLY